MSNIEMIRLTNVPHADIFSRRQTYTGSLPIRAARTTGGIGEQMTRLTNVPHADIFSRRQTYTDSFPTRAAGTPESIGGAALRLPTQRYAAALIPSALSTQGAYGGRSGGLGTAAPSTTPVALGPSLLTDFGSSVGKAGAGIMNTVGTIVPIAIKVIIAVIVIKIVLWLIRKRR